MSVTTDQMIADAVSRGETITALDLSLMLLGMAGFSGRHRDAPRLMWALHEVGLLHAGCYGSVPLVWRMAGRPSRTLPADRWRILFDRAGYRVDGVSAERPAEPLRLYRGAAHGWSAGWSWTDDLDVAHRYTGDYWARRPGVVWTADVEPWRLFARWTSTRTREAEYVVDTAGLSIDRL